MLRESTGRCLVNADPGAHRANDEKTTGAARPAEVYIPPLVRTGEVRGGGGDHGALATVTQWMHTYLTQPHVQLGRPGPICPYMSLALDLQTVWLATYSGPLDRASLISFVARYRDVFVTLEPREGAQERLKAILLLFPEVRPEHAPELIDSVQGRLKLDFVEAGLMLGQFHARNTAPGIHNPAFHPLRSPVPLLAIRYMVESDLPFMTQPTDPAHLRMRFLQAYLHHLGASLQSANRSRAERALQQAEREASGLSR